MSVLGETCWESEMVCYMVGGWRVDKSGLVVMKIVAPRLAMFDVQCFLVASTTLYWMIAEKADIVGRASKDWQCLYDFCV